MSLSKLDKLVLVPFISLFTLTLCVAIFTLLVNFLLVFFDELIGKELGLLTYLQLLSYFGIGFAPTVFPLATLVASVITLGNLGEYGELTALKSAGISMLRILLPLLVSVAILSSFLFFLSSYLVPQVNSKAYALLFDLRRKKPSIAIQEGVFYHGIPGYSIKVDQKLPDQRTLQGIMIYDHTQERGNVAVTIAASGQLCTLCGGQYLMLELFDGCSYLEAPAKATPKCKQRAIPSLTRSSFQVQKIIFDLASFRLARSSQDIFSYHHATKSTHQLHAEITRLKAEIKAAQQRVVEEFQCHWPILYQQLEDSAPPASSRQAARANTRCISPPPERTGEVPSRSERVAVAAAIPPDLCQDMLPQQTTQRALVQARDMHSKLKAQVHKIAAKQEDLRNHDVEKHSRFASAVGCMVMLLIGAPLGALPQRGGLGIPLLVSTVFILLYYVVAMLGVGWAKAGLTSSLIGAWLANLILLPFGMLLLRQAQQDTHLSVGDVYTASLALLMKFVEKR
ncbi:MAG: LptF/LptG family permease [Bacteroidota bacterium]